MDSDLSGRLLPALNRDVDAAHIAFRNALETAEGIGAGGLVIDELQEVRVWVGISSGDSARDVEVAHREDRKLADAPACFFEHLSADGVR